MITKINKDSDERPEVLKYLKEKNYSRVIDVGGAFTPWAKEYVTAYLDILDPNEYLKKHPEWLDENIKRSQIFLGDINDPDGWEEIVADVEKNGKFDFAICTHTLEDIRNPSYVVKQLQKIADDGFIAFPSLHWEFGRDVECNTDWEMNEWQITDAFRGFFHHRWILTIKDGILWMFPKLNFVDHLKGLEWVKGRNEWHELSFRWENDIPFRIFNDDFLGPNGPTALKKYIEQISPC